MDECHELDGEDCGNYKGSKRHAADIMRESQRSLHSLKTTLATVEEEGVSADNGQDNESQ